MHTKLDLEQREPQPLTASGSGSQREEMKRFRMLSDFHVHCRLSSGNRMEFPQDLSKRWTNLGESWTSAASDCSLPQLCSTGEQWCLYCFGLGLTPSHVLVPNEDPMHVL